MLTIQFILLIVAYAIVILIGRKGRNLSKVELISLLIFAVGMMLPFLSKLLDYLKNLNN